MGWQGSPVTEAPFALEMVDSLPRPVLFDLEGARGPGRSAVMTVWLGRWAAVALPRPTREYPMRGAGTLWM
ncbi:MAG: hypothetical protein EBZ36_15935 [Acidobacteria bacterium]|nr:hypothetical protein [Acidobacteriota bacterium]